MNFLSLFSGIEAASVAWNPLGWKALGFSDVDPFANAVLAHHYPNTPNYGDVQGYREWPDMRPDVIVGGSPCQSFSVAGDRRGLDDDRGKLTLDYLGVVERYNPTWTVWENVDGALSDRTNAFGQLVGALLDLGRSCSWRVLDAQYFGVPQRRKRIFLVSHSSGDWRYPTSVLFEQQSLRWNPAPRRKSGEDIAPTLSARTKGGGGLGTDFDLDGGLIPEVAHALTAKGQGYMDATAETFIPFDTTQITSKTNRCNPGPGDPCHPISASAHPPAIAFDPQAAGNQSKIGMEVERVNTLGRKKIPGVMITSVRAALAKFAVRRLTPIECERLQGFPDDFTKVPYRNRPAEKCAVGPRYKALGNSIAVPVVRWIGERIQAVDQLTK